jgi:8-oxo-dGTP pyrophosphatase MutT (NUDIX family)
MINVVELIKSSYKTDEATKNRFIHFVENNKNYYSRENPIGHITCSMLVLNESKDKTLLTHHKKLKCWLQLGGHWDNPEETSLDTAIRETSEEGYGNKPIVCHVFLNNLPLDIDDHLVNDKTGEHTHFDICYVCIVPDEFIINISDESFDLKWFSIDEIIDTDLCNQRLNRLLHKSKTINYNIFNKICFKG